MSVIYSTALKNARLDAITAAIGASGFLVIGTSSLAAPATGILAKIPLSATAAAAAAAGVLTLSGLPLSVVASAGGAAAKAELWTSANAAVATNLSVGTSATDVIIGTTTIASGNTVQVTAATITHG
jgi:hypothetical protein